MNTKSLKAVALAVLCLLTVCLNLGAQTPPINLPTPGRTLVSVDTNSVLYGFGTNLFKANTTLLTQALNSVGYSSTNALAPTDGTILVVTNSPNNWSVRVNPAALALVLYTNNNVKVYQDPAGSWILTNMTTGANSSMGANGHFSHTDTNGNSFTFNSAGQVLWNGNPVLTNTTTYAVASTNGSGYFLGVWVTNAGLSGVSGFYPSPSGYAPDGFTNGVNTIVTAGVGPNHFILKTNGVATGYTSPNALGLSTIFTSLTNTWTGGPPAAPTVTPVYGTIVIATNQLPGGNNWYLTSPTLVSPTLYGNALGQYITRVDTNLFQSYNINLQAMINLLPAQYNRATVGGGVIELGKGIFYTSSGNLFSGSGAQSLRIVGQGINQTYLVFTNAGDGLTVNGSLPNNTTLELKGLTIAANYDSMNFLVVAKSTAVTLYKEACFGYWPSLQNPVGPLSSGEIGTSAALLCGVNLPAQEGGMDSFEDCYFPCLNSAVVATDDHLRMNNCFFSGIGLNSRPSANWANAGYPELCSGAAIVSEGGYTDYEFNGCYFSFDEAVVMLNSDNSNYRHHLVFTGGHIEFCPFRVLTATNTPALPSIIPGETVQFVNCDNFNVTAEAFNDQWATWATSTSQPTYMYGTSPNVFEQNSTNNTSMDYYAGGNKILSLAATGGFLTGTSSVALSVPASGVFGSLSSSNIANAVAALGVLTTNTTVLTVSGSPTPAVNGTYVTNGNPASYLFGQTTEWTNSANTSFIIGLVGSTFEIESNIGIGPIWYSQSTLLGTYAPGIGSGNPVVSGVTVANALNILGNNGASFTNIPISGIAAPLVTNNQNNVTLGGTFSGSGYNLTSLNVSAVAALDVLTTNTTVLTVSGAPSPAVDATYVTNGNPASYFAGASAEWTNSVTTNFIIGLFGTTFEIQSNSGNIWYLSSSTLLGQYVPIIGPLSPVVSGSLAYLNGSGFTNVAQAALATTSVTANADTNNRPLTSLASYQDTTNAALAAAKAATNNLSGSLLPASSVLQSPLYITNANSLSVTCADTNFNGTYTRNIFNSPVSYSNIFTNSATTNLFLGTTGVIFGLASNWTAPYVYYAGSSGVSTVDTYTNYQNRDIGTAIVANIVTGSSSNGGSLFNLNPAGLAAGAIPTNVTINAASITGAIPTNVTINAASITGAIPTNVTISPVSFIAGAIPTNITINAASITSGNISTNALTNGLAQMGYTPGGGGGGTNSGGAATDISLATNSYFQFMTTPTNISCSSTTTGYVLTNGAFTFTVTGTPSRPGYYRLSGTLEVYITGSGLDFTFLAYTNAGSDVWRGGFIQPYSGTAGANLIPYQIGSYFTSGQVPAAEKNWPLYASSYDTSVTNVVIIVNSTVVTTQTNVYNLELYHSYSAVSSLSTNSTLTLERLPK